MVTWETRRPQFTKKYPFPQFRREKRKRWANGRSGQIPKLHENYSIWGQKYVLKAFIRDGSMTNSNFNTDREEENMTLFPVTCYIVSFNDRDGYYGQAISNVGE